MKRTYLALVILLVLSTFIPVFSGGRTQNNQVPTQLTIGLMPAVDIAPILVARDSGFFQQAGIEVDLQIFTSAQDRQSALQAGVIDGALTDLVAVALNVASGFQIRATTSTEGMFMILGNSEKLSSQPENPSIGLMEVSVTNFLADEWLGTTYRLDKVYINDIGARLEATVLGQTHMGMFPEPLATVGLGRGLDMVAQSSSQDFSPQVMAFTQEALENKEQAIRAFHRAYNQAVVAINRNPDLARDALVRSIPNLNPAIRDLITLPAYRAAYLPDSAFIQHILDWTAEVSKRNLTLTPSDLVDRRFIP